MPADRRKHIRARHCLPLLAAMSMLACAEPFIPRSGIATQDDTQGSDAFIAVSSGKDHSCALTADGAAHCWGSNELGQLGVPADTVTCLLEDRRVPCRRTPQRVTAPVTFSRIAAGGTHTCALASTNQIFCWGDNLYGQLGDPSVRQSFAPIPVLSTAFFVDVAAGETHSCGLRGDGVAFCWGENEAGQLGVSPIGNGSATPVSPFTSLRFTSITAGWLRTCARTADNAAYCWGALWTARQGGQEIFHAQPTPFRFQPPAAFHQLAAGNHAICGISSDVLAFCWDANPAGGVGDGTTNGSRLPTGVRSSVPMTAITSGGMHTCALSDTGQAYCWGAGDVGQLGISPSLLSARCTDDVLPCERQPARVSGWRAYGAISAGGNHVCALTLGGNIYCWGAGALGQRGDGRRSAAEWSPVKTASPEPVTTVTAAGKENP